MPHVAGNTRRSPNAVMAVSTWMATSGVRPTGSNNGQGTAPDPTYPCLFQARGDRLFSHLVLPADLEEIQAQRGDVTVQDHTALEQESNPGLLGSRAQVPGCVITA